MLSATTRWRTAASQLSILPGPMGPIPEDSRAQIPAGYGQRPVDAAPRGRRGGHSGGAGSAAASPANAADVAPGVATPRSIGEKVHSTALPSPREMRRLTEKLGLDYRRGYWSDVRNSWAVNLCIGDILMFKYPRGDRRGSDRVIQIKEFKHKEKDWRDWQALSFDPSASL